VWWSFEDTLDGRSAHLFSFVDSFRAQLSLLRVKSDTRVAAAVFVHQVSEWVTPGRKGASCQCFDSNLLRLHFIPNSTPPPRIRPPTAANCFHADRRERPWSPKMLKGILALHSLCSEYLPSLWVSVLCFLHSLSLSPSPFRPLLSFVCWCNSGRLFNSFSLF
jgi:hypothetical protein